MFSSIKMAGLTMLLLSAIAFRPAPASDLMGDYSDTWDPGSQDSRFASLDEERFQMECDYLDIGGDRKEQARNLFERMMAGRDEVISDRDAGRITRAEAIEKLDSLDLEYYTALRSSVKGKKNLKRLERMIRKAGARGADDSSALKSTAPGEKAGQ